MGNPVKAFSELEFLFNGKRRFLSRIDTVEGEYLYNLVAEKDNPLVVEIGRFIGGTTILLAHAGCKLISIDNRSFQWTPVIDRYVKTLTKGLDVTLEIANSYEYDNSSLDVDVVFIDGDHSRNGVMKDFQHWLPRVKKGGDIVFHDINLMSVRGFIETVDLERIPSVGTLAHFKK
jgi:predicted O-methyltransferase YrrM